MSHTTADRELGESEASRRHGPGNEAVADRGLVEVRLRELSQLFDSLDPSPFREKDLEPNVEQYIVDSVKEHSARTPSALVIFLSRSTDCADDARVAGDAIRIHFKRRSSVVRRQLRQLLRRGVISLGIGVAFLAVIFLAIQVLDRMRLENSWVILLRESLLIVGWVAMWRPLEIFLYDWWPIVGEQRLYDRLSAIPVRIVPSQPDLNQPAPRQDAGASGAPAPLESEPTVGSNS